MGPRIKEWPFVSLSFAEEVGKVCFSGAKPMETMGHGAVVVQRNQLQDRDI